MKWTILLLLISMITMLGCNPQPAPDKEQSPAPESQEAVDFDEAMSAYEPGTWLTDYEEALRVAKEINKPILVNFTGSDWCSWCMKLSGEVFTKDAFIDYAKSSLVLLKLDFPRKKAQSAEEKAANEKLMNEYGVQGFPTIVLLSAEGKELNRTGYQPGGAAAYVKHLQELLTK